SELFGGIHGGGEDHHAKILLDIEDAFHGAVRQISLRVPKMDSHGRVFLENRALNVKIPKGVKEGQVIRLAGQGGQGDLLLEVHFRPHERYHVEGRNIRLTLPVSPWEAALGAVVPVEMPGGVLRIRIPPGAQGGKQLRVQGKGIPGNPAGDLLIEIQIVLPSADTARAREIYETMARELAFDPRRRG
ncbi:MAG TPA: J domain-containing protein, partial [Burkholderiales bacterium]|nr:J domain-containing protein [Burkholderiales bacterium]